MKKIEAAYRDATVVLTGAAGGLGSNMARLLAPFWKRALLPDINEEGLSRLAKELDPNGEKIVTRILDLSKPHEVSGVLADLPPEFETPDLVINNAGFSKMGRVEEMPLADFEAMSAVNYLAVVAVIKRFLPAMLAARKGQFLTIASGSGVLANYAGAGYCASKFATVGFMEAFRQEVQGTGLRTSTVLLPTVMSDFHKKVLASKYGELARSLPTHTPEAAARKVLMRAARGDEVIEFGFVLRLGLFMNAHFPRTFRKLMALTGYRANQRYLFGKAA